MRESEEFRISQTKFKSYCEKYICIDACGLEKEAIEEIGTGYHWYHKPSPEQNGYNWFDDNEQYKPKDFLYLSDYQFYVPIEILDNLKYKLDKILNE